MTEEEQFTADFERLAPAVQKSLEYSLPTHTIADVAKGVSEGRMHFWPVKDSAVITEIYDAPQMRILNIFIGAGNAEDILDGEERYISFAKFMGCSHIAFLGRSGWKIALKQRGWTDHKMSYFSKAV